VEIFEQLCYMAVAMMMLRFWAGANPERACQSVVLGSGISACFTLLCLSILRLKERPPKGTRIPVTSRLLKTALPLAIADDLKAGISTTENLMVPKRLALFPDEVSPLAAFGVVCGMVFPVLMFPAAILFALAELLIPELARCNAAGSQQRIRYLAKRSLKIALLYGLLCGGIMHLIAEPLCLKLYGNTEAGASLRLYTILIPMLYCDAIVDAMVKGLGQQTASVRYNIFTSTLDVVFLFLLLPRHGMQGYFFSFFVTHLINFFLSLRRLIKITNIQIPFYIPVFAWSAGLAGVFGAFFVPSIPFRILAFLGINGSLLALFGVISRKDLHWLKGLIKK
jgi:stage V sporulation protein B